MKKKRSTKKKVAKKSAPRPTNVVIRVQSMPMLPTVPTVHDLVEPLSEGKKLTIPKTWMSDKQILRLVERTPPAQVYKRPGKGGKQWDYVTVSYVQRVLDYTFGFNWDFDIVQHGKEKDHVWVMGKLIVRNPEGTQSITKTQFGRSEVKYKKDSTDLLDYGNDLKSAASDALKKCASMLGIARDIYGKTDYKAESGREPRDVTPTPAPPKAPQAPAPIVVEEIYCHGFKRGGCPEGSELSPVARDYSVKLYGKPLCANCQKQATPVKK